MPENYVLLERTELNASAASVTFANIPQTGYTDLKIVMSVRTDFASTNDNIKLSFNGSTASFSARRLYGSGSAAASDTLTDNTSGIVCDGASATASTFSNAELYVPNYLGGTNKSYSADSVAETNATTTYMYLVAGLWSNTAAISSVTFTPQGGTNFVAGSTFSLYGIAALGTTPAIAPKADGGNRIDNDGTYWYHTFTSSGTFTPQVGLTADVLVIAGGGGGLSGGGGAGGLAYYSSQSVTTTSYACTIGGGGGSYANGVDSTFQGLTAAVGGGRGGANSSTNPASNGGSGGGSMGLTSSPFGALAGGTGTTGQGNNGGSGFWGNAYAGGGGGGAGAVGGNSSTSGTSVAGNGGNGVNTFSSWASATSTGLSGFYAGGGGGASNLAGQTGGTAGSGGSGGGGAGTLSSAGGAATISTGGGGGGGQSTGGAGGSGIIIVRYPIAS
jgi:hypothetical protein